jgi:hypothetical protein
VLLQLGCCWLVLVVVVEVLARRLWAGLARRAAGWPGGWSLEIVSKDTAAAGVGGNILQAEEEAEAGMSKGVKSCGPSVSSLPEDA